MRLKVEQKGESVILKHILCSQSIRQILSFVPPETFGRNTYSGNGIPPGSLHFPGSKCTSG